MLEKLLKEEIKKINNGDINSERIVSFIDYKNPYAILKSKVYVEIELKKGIKVTLDISDLFKEEF